MNGALRTKLALLNCFSVVLEEAEPGPTHKVSSARSEGHTVSQVPTRQQPREEVHHLFYRESQQTGAIPVEQNNAKSSVKPQIRRVASALVPGCKKDPPHSFAQPVMVIIHSIASSGKAVDYMTINPRRISGNRAWRLPKTGGGGEAGTFLTSWTRSSI